MKKIISFFRIFNVFDLIISISVILLIISTIYYFTVSNLGITNQDNGLKLALRIDITEAELAEKFKPGDRIYDSFSNSVIGMIESTEISDCTVRIPTENGSAIKVYPNCKTVTLIVNAVGYLPKTKNSSTSFVSGGDTYYNGSEGEFRTNTVQFRASVEIMNNGGEQK